MSVPSPPSRPVRQGMPGWNCKKCEKYEKRALILKPGTERSWMRDINREEGHLALLSSQTSPLGCRGAGRGAEKTQPASTSLDPISR